MEGMHAATMIWKVGRTFSTISQNVLLKYIYFDHGHYHSAGCVPRSNRRCLGDPQLAGHPYVENWHVHEQKLAVICSFIVIRHYHHHNNSKNQYHGVTDREENGGLRSGGDSVVRWWNWQTTSPTRYMGKGLPTRISSQNLLPVRSRNERNIEGTTGTFGHNLFEFDVFWTCGEVWWKIIQLVQDGSRNARGCRIRRQNGWRCCTMHPSTMAMGISEDPSKVVHGLAPRVSIHSTTDGNWWRTRSNRAAGLLSHGRIIPRLGERSLGTDRCTGILS